MGLGGWVGGGGVIAFAVMEATERRNGTSYGRLINGNAIGSDIYFAEDFPDFDDLCYCSNFSFKACRDI